MSENVLKNVMIGTPSIDGKVTMHYMMSLLQTVIKGFQKGYAIEPLIMPYDSDLCKARNSLFKIAYENKVDALIFIDADEGWNSEDIFKLLDAPENIIGAIFRKKTDERIDFNVRKFKKPEQLVLEKNGLIEVEGIGTGMLKITKEVIKKAYEKSALYLHEGQKFKRVFNPVIDTNGEYLSEDISFCKFCREKLKEKIWLNPFINTVHIGVKEFGINFMEWLKQNNMVKVINGNS